MSRFYPALILPKLLLPTLLLLLIPVFAGQANPPAGSPESENARPAMAASAHPVGAAGAADSTDGSDGQSTLMVVGFDGESHYAGSVLLIRLDRVRATLRTVQIAGNCYVRDADCPDGRLGSAFAVGYGDARDAGADEDAACRAGAIRLSALIDRTLGVRPDGCVSLSYGDFAAIVDRAGGVDICLPHDFLCSDGLRLPAGTNHINGAAAQRFVRFGRPDGEIHPQRLFLTALLKKVKREFSLPRALALGRYAYSLSHHDLSAPRMLSVLRAALSVDLSEARIAELSGVERPVNGQPRVILNRGRSRDLVNYYLDAAQSDDAFDPGERLTDPSDPSIDSIYRCSPGMAGVDGRIPSTR